MLSTAIIIFREVLEAALIIGIACAATRGVSQRGWWVSGGIALGVLGACLVALFAGAIGGAAEGVGQELLNAAILLAAVLMLGWHNVWMARHGREMAAEMKSLGGAVKSGDKPLFALGLVILLAVLREGSEVVLFVYGIAAGGGDTAQMLSGGLIGLATGTLAGVVLYYGLLKVPVRHFFSVTSWMILLLAAGLASQAARFLIQADWLPAMGEQIWDTSDWLAADSWLGQVLQTLIGYDPRPAGAQLMFYLISLITIGAAMRFFGGSKGAPSTSTPAGMAAGVLLVSALAMAGLPQRAEAGPADKVYKPLVEFGEFEIELRGGYDKQDSGNKQAYVVDFGYGVTPWWFTELVVEAEKSAGSKLEVEALEWENIFQLTEQGQYWADLGLLVEYEKALESGHPDELKIGPMLQKEIGRTVNNLNLLAERQFGDNRSTETELLYRFQSVLRRDAPVNFGVQGFGAENTHLWGPALFGGGRMDQGKFKYDAALLAGLTDDSPDFRFRWEVEFEF